MFSQRELDTGLKDEAQRFHKLYLQELEEKKYWRGKFNDERQRGSLAPTLNPSKSKPISYAEAAEPVANQRLLSIFGLDNKSKTTTSPIATTSYWVNSRDTNVLQGQVLHSMKREKLKTRSLCNG